MRSWLRAFRFLWEEESTVVPPVQSTDAGKDAVGVPRVLRNVARWSMMVGIGTLLMGQVIGIRLIAPVDAQPTHVSALKGNEGVGNGEDPPPPGHDQNYNDYAGTSPGDPGSKGGANSGTSPGSDKKP